MGAVLDEALAAWATVLGAQHVTVDGRALSEAGRATFATTATVQAILRPGTRDQVAAAVVIANRFRVPLYPYSTGKNWGYGSRAPVQDGVLLDLGRLDQIIEVNEDLAYVTIEPGVTQRQLFEGLRARGSRLWMDATGASPDCSIIGNTLERGFGHTPMGDHCGSACGMEVVLPSGECVNTGFGRFPGSRAAAVSRWGVGPSLDGLFSQSNLGIVTRMSVWLMPAPEHFEAFFFMSRNSDLGAIVQALRPLRLDGTLRSVMHIGNDYKVLAAASQFPWHDTSVRPPLGRETLATVQKTMGIGAWNGTGGLYGTKAQVREAKRRVRAALNGKVDRLHFVNDRLLRMMSRFAKPFHLMTGWDVQKTLKVIEPVYNLLRGVPTDGTLASAYWRKRSEVPAAPDPDRDGCGLLWCSPVVPALAEDLRVVTALATDVLLAHGFEPQMSISLANERSAICIITIAYDRDIPGEDARAISCYRRLTEDLLTRGYPPYRVNVVAMDLLNGQEGYDTALRAIKTALDPHGILAPGRYDASAPAANARDRGLDVA